MFSYWERQHFFSYDYIIAGAGITGLSTAIELKNLFPHRRIVVLERGFLPSGASTKNAGFACMGSVSELMDDLQTMTKEEVCRLFEMRKNGLQILRQRLSDEKIGYTANGSYELINFGDEYLKDKIGAFNEMLRPIVGSDAFAVADGKLDEFGFSKKTVSGLIQNLCEGEIDSGKMMRSLADMAMQLGIEIKTGTLVSAFSEMENEVKVCIGDPFSKEEIVLKAGSIIICTNAFAKQLLPGEDLTPGRGQVLITRPVKNLKFKGIFHFDKGYYYFREINGRILFGGGRNMDFKTEATTEFGINEAINEDLEQKLKEIICPDEAIEIDQRWSGIMAFGKVKFPVIKAVTPRVYMAGRMGGMGVALASEAARQLAVLVYERCE